MGTSGDQNIISYINEGYAMCYNAIEATFIGTRVEELALRISQFKLCPCRTKSWYGMGSEKKNPPFGVHATHSASFDQSFLLA